MATLPINPLPTAQPQSPPPPGMANTQPQTSMQTSTSIQSTGSQPLNTPFSATATSQPEPAPVAGAQTPSPFPTSPYGAHGVGTYTPVADEANIVSNYLNQLIGADSPLMRNARTLGIEQAAARGLQNSSIAAGNAQRAALDAALPLTQQALDMFNQREGRQWQTSERLGQQGFQREERLGQQEFQREERLGQQDWTSEENRLDRQQQLTMAEVQNWLNNESFMREFNAQLALAPVANTFQLLQMIMQQAVEQPDVYTPDVVSGFSEFFNTNMLDILARYFPTLYRANTGGA